MPCIFRLLSKDAGKLNIIFFPGGILLLGSHPLAAQESNAPPMISTVVLTNLAQFWELSSEEKKLPHHTRFNFLIYYCDPVWNVYWGRSDDLDSFLPLRGIPKQLEAGDEVDIDGLIVPIQEEFLWDKTSINILLYLPFPLTLSGTNSLGRWDCLRACRPEGSGAGEFVTLWHWPLARCAGSQNRSCLCPKLEPLIERPTKASSHLQE
jgi:hypothetical protein